MDTKAKLWEQRFSLLDLLELKARFEEVGAVKEPEFVELINHALSNEAEDYGVKVSLEEIQRFFLMIDADASGSVSWAEFSNYLFLPNSSGAPGKEENHSRDIFPLVTPAPICHVKHTDTISCIRKITRRFKYYQDVFLTSSRGGKVLAWNCNSLEYHSTVVAHLGWVTSIVHMKKHHRLAVSTTSSVHIFDIINRETFTVRPFGMVPQWLLAHATPMHLAYLWDEAKLTEYLVIADNDGILTSYSFFGPSHLPILLDPQEKMSNQNFSDFTKVQRVKMHSDHITHLVYEKDLGMFISSSLDGTIKLFEIDRLKKIRAVFRGHEKGSNGFTYNERAKLMASCGLERSIYLWRPMAPDAHFELEGHTATVKSIQSIRGTNEIVSLDAHGTVKVWDIRHQHCLQTLFGITGELKMTSFFMDSTLEILVTASRTLSKWPVSRGGIAEQTKECRVPLSHALYNRNFRQVITVMQHDSTIHLWDIETGAYLFPVATVDPEASKDKYLLDLTDITAISLDDGHRRVLIGTHTGDKVTVWNTSNGKCLRVLEKKVTGQAPRIEPSKPMPGKSSPDGQDKPTENTPETAEDGLSRKGPTVYGPRADEEISAIASVIVVEPLGGEKGIHIRKLTASAGWDKRIHVWAEDNRSNSLELQCFRKIPNDSFSSPVMHQGDIRAIAFCSPCYIATGCSEGKTIVWHMTTSSVHFVYDSGSTIASLAWSERLKLLLVCRENGSISFLNARDGALYCDYTPKTKPIGLLSCYGIDFFETYLSAGDENGNIRVWTLGDPPEDDNMLTMVSHFRAHESMSITAINFVESYEWNDMFILSAGRDGYACLWTIAGIPVGYFGQEIPWVLGDSSTFFSESSDPVVDDEKMLNEAYVLGEGQPTAEAKRMLTKINELEATIQENLDCKLPRVGEVWQLEDTDMKKNFLEDESARPADYIVDVGTVLRVDVAVDLIVLLNGLLGTDNCAEGEKRSAPLSLFYGAKKRNADGTLNTLKWVKNVKMSSFIGRVFTDSIGVQYKTVYARHDIQHNWFLVDTSGIAHEIVDDSDDVPTNRAKIGRSQSLRRNRSMSLFKSLTRMESLYNHHHAFDECDGQKAEGYTPGKTATTKGGSRGDQPPTESLPAEGEGDRPPAAAKSSKSDSVQRAEKVGLVAAPPPHARVVSRSEHLHLKARKHKWYDDYEGRDMDLLRRLQSMSRHKVDSVMDPVLAPHPPAKKKKSSAPKVLTNDEVLSVVKNRHVFHPTKRKRIFDKRVVHGTDKVPTVYKRKDLKKARQERMKGVAGMGYSLPEI
jgi:WD40 repeat protein